MMDIRIAKEKVLRAAEMFAPLSDEMLEAIDTVREAELRAA